MAKEAQPKTVVLVDKDGNDFSARTPGEVSNLVFGSGYRVKDKNVNVDQAMASLVEQQEAAQEAAPVGKPSDAPKAADK